MKFLSILSSKSDSINPLVILAILVGFFGILVLCIILVKKFIKPLQITKNEMTEEEAAEEELKRVLVDVEDENVKKQMDEDLKNNGR